MVAPDDAVHIAWHNHDDADANHALARGKEVTRHRINTPDSHNGWDNSLALDGDGGLHQASVFPSAFGASESLEYSSFDGQAWSYEIVPGSGPFMYGLNTSIAIDRRGHPHVVYCRTEGFRLPGDLMYAFRDDQGWHALPVVTDGIRGRFPTLALDHWDRAHIAWLDADPKDESKAFVRYAVRNNDAWEVEDVDVLEDVVLSMDEARKSTSLALDREFRPHIAFGDRSVVKYARKPFATWEVETVLETSVPKYKGLVVLRLDALERPAIAFWQAHPTEAGVVRLLAARADAAGGRIPGDCNGDNELSLSDPVCLLEHLFFGRPGGLPCVGGGTAAGGNKTFFDANADDRVDLSDALHLLSFLFLGGPPHVLGVDCARIEGCVASCN